MLLGALLKTWFTTWFDSQCPKDMKKLDGQFAPQMLFPCFACDYALRFKKITHALAYHWPHHIYKVNPTDESKIYIPPRILRKFSNLIPSAYPEIKADIWFQSS